MKITNDDAFTIHTALSMIEQPKFEDIKNLEDREDYIFHTDFVLAVAYNKRKLKDIVESLQESQENTPEYKDYLEERNKILEKHSIKDENGAPMERVEILPSGQRRRSFVVPDLADSDTVAARTIAKLEKANDDHIKRREEQNEEFKKALKEEIEVDLKVIRWSRVPRGLQPLVMDGLIFFIDEDTVPGDEEPEEKSKPKK